MSQSVKLKLSKFTDFVHRYKYIVSGIFCEEDKVKFIECRTPKYQKTFMVYISPNFLMKCDNNGHSVKQTNIISSEEEASDNQVSFLSEMKGPLLESDILSVSSHGLCMYKNSGKMECYSIKGDEDSESEEESGEGEVAENEDQIALLESETNKIMNKLNPENNLAIPQIKIKEKSSSLNEQPVSDEKEDVKNITTFRSNNEVKNPEGYTEEQIEQRNKLLSASEENNEGKEIVKENISNKYDEYEDKTKDNGENEEEGETELVFEDENGNVIEEEVEVEDIAKQDNEDGEVEEIEGEDEGISTGDNSIPEEMEELDINLGIVYVVVPISIFFKKIQTMEKTLLDSYEQLDDNENDIRNNRFKQVKELTEEFLSHGEERLKEILTNEDELKNQLLRLTVILAQTEAMKNEVETNNKLRGISHEVDRVYNKTRKSIHDINIELLKYRDQADELLTNYFSSIKELISL